MPWYFYGRGGVAVTPRPSGVLSPGAIILSPLPYSATEPEGYLFCNGQQVSKMTYLDLFAEIGGIFGFSDASVFTVPDLRTRMPRGIVSSAAGIGVPPFNATFPYAFASGVGGTKTHNHTVAAHTHPMASNHSHTLAAHSHTFPNHTHTMLNHDHNAGSLSIGGSNDIKPDADTREDTQYYEQQAVTDEPGAHNHGGQVGGTTGNVSTISGVNDPNNSSAPASVPADNTLDAFNISGASGSSGPFISNSVSQYPPYYTVSFLIKT